MRKKPRTLGPAPRSSAGSKSARGASRRSSSTPPAHNEFELRGPFANLLVELDDPRFAQREMHHAIEDLDRRGVTSWREHRTPERILSWIDAEFGGTKSIEAAAGGIWVAEDAAGPVAFVSFDVRGLPYRWLQNWKNERFVGILGSYGVMERGRRKGIMRVLLHAAMFSMLERTYRRALVPAVPLALVPFFEKNLNAWFVENVETAWRGETFRTVVLASGNGSNFQAVVEAAADGMLPIHVAQLIVNKPAAFVLERAVSLDVPARAVVWKREEESRDAYDLRVIAALADAKPQLVLFLGWMHVLPYTFTARFPETLNVHPAFLPLDPALDFVTMPDGSSLPAYRGAHAFADALASGNAWSGASVHRVGAAVDRGELFARAPLHLVPGADPAALRDRLQKLERTVVADAVRAWSYRQPFGAGV